MSPRTVNPAISLATHAGGEVELFGGVGHDGHVREVSQEFATLLGLEISAIEGRSVLELVHPEDLETVVVGIAALEAGAPEYVLDTRFRQSDGQHLRLEWAARPVPGTDLWSASGRDTTEFHAVLAERVAMRARLDLAAGHSRTAMWSLDVRADVITWEDHVGGVIGSTDGAAPTSIAALADAAHTDDRDAVLGVPALLASDGAIELGFRIHEGTEMRHLSLRGKVIDHDHRGRPARAVGLILDVSLEKAVEEQLQTMIMTDALTGVPNRRSFDRTFRNEWRRHRRSREPVSVVMVDIDNFKSFNDSFGHLVGDEVLCDVANAVTRALHRAGDSVSRFGGEEFVVLLPSTDANGALVVAEALVESVRRIALRSPADDWKLSISAGTATWDPQTDSMEAEELVDLADRALYVAKASGKDRAASYARSLAPGAELEAAIVSGLESGEFCLFYQPIIDLRRGSVVGFEALMRWNRPGHGMVFPDGFIEIAERSDLICKLDAWAMIEASEQLVAWTRDGADLGQPLYVAVNASARHVSSPAIVRNVEAALAASMLDPGRLQLELTETAIGDSSRVHGHLQTIRDLGVSVAIDDFGAGNTSISSIATLPADVLKIDRSLVAHADPRWKELVKLTIGAAHAFDLSVVAEGIEDVETRDWVRLHGADSAQGYWFARPMPASEVAGWLGVNALSGCGS